MLPVWIYDDGKCPLAPLTDLRAAFDVRTGALSNLERLKRSWGIEPSLIGPAPISDLVQEAHPRAQVNAALPSAPVLAVNGRWVGPFDDSVRELRAGSALVERGTGALLAAAVPGGDLPRVMSGDLSGLTLREHQAAERQLLERPWHFRTARDFAIGLDLQLLTESRGSKPAPAIRIDPTAKVHSTAVLDAEYGTIVIGAHAVIRPQSVIIGPAYVGPHSTVVERAVIRANTAIGPWCKVGGEVGGVIFQGFANKAHDGYLGDSWVGEWVNLGAGTTNSNLLNTYGEIVARATPDGRNERTGEQFLGAVIGDHVKTAICTRIMTGCIIHAGTMWAANAAMSGCLAPFTWRTEEGNRQYRLSRFLEVARAMMGRRSVTPSAAYEARLADLHGLAAGLFAG